MGPDIFISYAKKDICFVEQVVKALQNNGWAVWWDKCIRAGQQWDEMIQKNLNSARLVLVLWSKTSITRRWVKNEARFSQNRGILVPVIIDDIELPIEFSDLQSVYLGGWAGDTNDPNFLQLVENISEKLNSEQKIAPLQKNPFKKNKEQQSTVAGMSMGVNPAMLSNLVIFKDVNASWCPQMIVIPNGEFMMGSPKLDNAAFPDEYLQHRVVISYRFGIGRFLITFSEYDSFAKATGRDYPGDSTWGRAKHPVINITWEDARAYTEWLSLQTNQEYRLPSEAEWEYACRAGTITPYAFGNNINTDLANFDGFVGKTTLVGSYKKNPWGIYDMHGNVCEWVEDTWHDNYDLAPEDGSPWVDEQNNALRVIRGGSWNDYHRTTRSAVRGKELVSNRYNFVGFRVVRTL